MPPPQWKTLNQEQQRFLLEAFQVSPEMTQSFASGVPDEWKQNMLNSLWGALTPEKRIQVALYAHIQKPFDSQAETTAKVIAPRWEKLTKLQQFRVYEASRMDNTQRGIFESLPPDMRQAAFETLWAYLDPAARQRVLAP